MAKETLDACEYCGTPLGRTRKTIPFHSAGRTVYFEDVPIWSCPDCGYVEFEAAVYKDLERKARAAGKSKRTISFPLLRLARAGPARLAAPGTRKGRRNGAGMPRA
jgi:YgiT-type zinc finger domain-containing protein